MVLMIFLSFSYIHAQKLVKLPNDTCYIYKLHYVESMTMSIYLYVWISFSWIIFLFLKKGSFYRICKFSFNYADHKLVKTTCVQSSPYIHPNSFFANLSLYGSFASRYHTLKRKWEGLSSGFIYVRLPRPFSIYRPFNHTSSEKAL